MITDIYNCIIAQIVQKNTNQMDFSLLWDCSYNFL